MATPLDVAAAQLALLAARSGISRKIQIRGTRIRFPRLHGRFDPEGVVERLTAAPKPLFLTAREAGGSVELSYRPLLPSTPEFDWYEKGLELSRQHGGFMSYLHARYGGAPETLTVHCVGRNETLLVPLAAVEKWDTDYEVAHVNMRGDDVGNPWCTDWPDYVDAKKHGASGIIIFTSPEDDAVRVVVKITEDRG